MMSKKPTPKCGTNTVEADIHVMCEPESESLSALFTLSVDGYCMAVSLPKKAFLEAFADYLDALADTGRG